MSSRQAGSSLVRNVQLIDAEPRELDAAGIQGLAARIDRRHVVNRSGHTQAIVMKRRSVNLVRASVREEERRIGRRRRLRHAQHIGGRKDDRGVQQLELYGQRGGDV